jgi:hypothetical protein
MRSALPLLLVWVLGNEACADEVIRPSNGKSIEFPQRYGYRLPDGEGIEAVQKCSFCHSFGYILNQGRQSQAYWQLETHKMIETYKAPIDPNEEQLIVKYLNHFYGNGR